MVNELSVGCLNDECEDVIRKGDIEKHLKVCEFTPILCPNNSVCGAVRRRDLETHKTKLCPFRIVECLLNCGLMLPLNDIEDHLKDDCPKTTIKCKNHCGGIVERGEMERHITVDCPLEMTDCPNKGESLFEEWC